MQHTNSEMDTSSVKVCHAQQISTAKTQRPQNIMK